MCNEDDNVDDYVAVGNGDDGDEDIADTRRGDEVGGRDVVGDHGDDDDRKPAAEPRVDDRDYDGKDEEEDEEERDDDDRDDRDRRFLCSICLDVVSDEPVVTRCGHLYCWPCLYTWLEPGIDDREYRAAFGGQYINDYHDYDDGERRMRRRGRMVGSLLLQSSPPRHHNMSTSNRHQESRRRCPVCNAHCTVDSVVPIYVNNRGVRRWKDVTNESSGGGVAGGDVLPSSSSSRGLMSGEADVDDRLGIGMRRMCSLNEDENNHNDEGRRRRRQRDQRGRDGSPPPTEATRSPTLSGRSGRRTVPNDADEYKNSEVNDYNDDDGCDYDTPIHRNTSGGGVAVRGEGGDFTDGRDYDRGMRLPSTTISTTTTITAGVGVHQRLGSPPRPTSRLLPRNDADPTTSGSWILGSEAAVAAASTTSAHPPPPELDPAFSSSSPFRLGLRPRRPHPAQQHQRREGTSRDDVATSSSTFDDDLDRRLVRQRRYFGGRLTSALMMIVDAIDNAATNATSMTGGIGMGDGGSSTADGGGQPRSRIPSLHRTDGGQRGGSEGSSSLGGEVNRYRNINDTANVIREEEDSSLATARDFLSRLFTMLGDDIQTATCVPET
ncbi:hypothetical protein ACHAXA_006827 [Cyclostephanos tholiformis]|uniref:RING-type E3 ubiquitin transferase n=1 Tax=Cyclostephanos tholiformis TaxID=382380 RepID=A0ABD3RCT0_9STRA